MRSSRSLLEDFISNFPLNQPPDQNSADMGTEEGTQDKDHLLKSLMQFSAEDMDFKGFDGVKSSTEGRHQGPNLQLFGQTEHGIHRGVVAKKGTDSSQY